MSETLHSHRPLAEILRNRAKDIRPEQLTTPLEGVSIKVVPGTELDLPTTAVRSLARAGRSLHKIKGQIFRATQRKDSKTNVLTEFAKNHPGFRGLRSTPDNLSVSVFPTSEVKYNEKNLRKALGAAATTVIGQEVRATLSIPLGHVTPDGGGPLTSRMAQNSLKEAVRGLGFSKRASRSILDIEVVPTYDELKLHELVENGQVTLPDDVAEITETFQVRSELIDKSQTLPRVVHYTPLNQTPTI